MRPVEPKRIVRDGYAHAADEYESHYRKIAESQYPEWLNYLIERLTAQARILDLGCGAGTPVAKYLASQFKVTGIDISEVQIGRARHEIPRAHFICADMTEVVFSPFSFEAVIALYSIIHVPLEEQRTIFAAIASWLSPSGYLLATVGDPAWTGIEENWLGVPGVTMYYSCADAATYRRWLVDLGFAIIWEEFVPEGPEDGHVLFFAQLTGPPNT